MKFEKTFTVADGDTSVTPIATPQNVPKDRIFSIGPHRPNTDQITRVLMFALEATNAETVTADVYAVDESTLGGALTARRFYQVASGITLTGGETTSVSGVPGGGLYFLDVTAETLVLNAVRPVHVLGLPA